MNGVRQMHARTEMKPHRTNSIAPRPAIIVMMLALSIAIPARDLYAQDVAMTNAQAASQGDASHNRTADIGQATHDWLDLQRSNAAAAPALPTPGAQASLAYERYMDSFRTKIPATFGSALSGANNAGPIGHSSMGAAQPSGAN